MVGITLFFTFITFMVSITFTGNTLVHERLSLAERDAGIKGNSAFYIYNNFAIYCFYRQKIAPCFKHGAGIEVNVFY